MRPKPALGAAMLAASLANSAPTSADLITLTALDSGYYESSLSGSHFPSNENYIVAWFAHQGEFRNFFVFDLSTVNGRITTAKLALRNLEARTPDEHFPSGYPGGFQSADETETYELYDVATPVSELRAGGEGKSSIFADLGSGSVYGSYIASSSDNGTTILIPMNSSALGALNAASGLFAIGGAITTLRRELDNEMLFAASQFPPLVRELRLTTVIPETSTFLLVGAGLLGLALRRRRIKSVQAQRRWKGKTIDCASAP